LSDFITRIIRPQTTLTTGEGCPLKWSDQALRKIGGGTKNRPQKGNDNCFRRAIWTQEGGNEAQTTKDDKRRKRAGLKRTRLRGKGTHRSISGGVWGVETSSSQGDEKGKKEKRRPPEERSDQSTSINDQRNPGRPTAGTLGEKRVISPKEGVEKKKEGGGKTPAKSVSVVQGKRPGLFKEN